MTLRQLCVIALRLTALWTLLNAGTALSNSWQSLNLARIMSRGSSSGFFNSDTLLPFLALGSVAMMLWLFATPLAILLTGHDGSRTDLPQATFGSRDFASVLIGVVGIYIVVTAAPALASNLLLIGWSQVSSGITPGSGWGNYVLVPVLDSSSRVVLGTLLVLLAPRLAYRLARDTRED
jgi:hypothetical protein